MKAIITISYALLCLGMATAQDREVLRQRIQEIYTAELGVREATGRNDGSRVEEYLRYCGLGKGNAWCAAFVSWVYGQAGLSKPRTAWAAALFPRAKQVDLKTYNLQRTTSVGLVFGIYYPSLKRIGHCGFVDGVEGGTIITVEGNTNEAGSREGDGVYRKRRPVKSIHALADWL